MRHPTDTISVVAMVPTSTGTMKVTVTDTVPMNYTLTQLVLAYEEALKVAEDKRHAIITEVLGAVRL